MNQKQKLQTYKVDIDTKTSRGKTEWATGKYMGLRQQQNIRGFSRAGVTAGWDIGVDRSEGSGGRVSVWTGG